jgi:tetratricopeptide (TPR) repeat protein
MRRGKNKEEQLELSNGQGVEIAVDDLIASARHAAAEENYQLAYEQLYDLIYQAEQAGLAPVVLQLIKELYSIIPEAKITATDKAWLLNSEGLALGHMGQMNEALACFERMNSIGQEQKDLQITSTALQNLGTQAIIAHDYDAGRRRYSESIQQKVEVKDYHGAAQVILNTASLECERGNLDEADRLLGIAETFLVPVRGESHLRITLDGIKALVAIKRKDYHSAETFLRHALQLSRRIGDLLAEENSLGNLASVKSEMGDLRNAIRWYMRAIRLAEAMGVPPLQVLGYEGLAKALYHTGRKKEAVQWLEKAFALVQDYEDPRTKARTIADLGAMVADTGDLNRGRELLEIALPDLRRLQLLDYEKQTLSNLFTFETLVGNFESSKKYLEQVVALTPSEIEEHSRLSQRAGVTWLRTHHDTEKALYFFQRSIEDYERALQKHDVADGKRHLAWLTVQTATALSKARHNELALPYYESALTAYEQLGDIQSVFHTCNDIGNALTELDRYDEAWKCYERNLSLSKHLKDRAMRLHTLLNYGESLRRADQYDRALVMLKPALQLSRELGDQEAEELIVSNIASAWVDKGNLVKGMRGFEDALRIATSMSRTDRIANAYSGLGNVAFFRDYFADATALYQKASKLYASIDIKQGQLDLLGAALIAISAEGNKKKLDAVGQRVIDLAQEIGEPESAYISLAKAARWWLDRGQLEQAAELYSASVGIVAAGMSSSASAEEWVTAVVLPLTYMAVHIKLSGEIDTSKLLELFFAKMARQNENSVDFVRPLLEEVLATVDVGATEDDFETEDPSMRKTTRTGDYPHLWPSSERKA